MLKPQVYILSYGLLEKPQKPKLEGALGLRVLTGLIVYESQGQKKGMVVDPGLTVDWPEHKRKIEAFGLKLQDITHLLCTHFHQDHVQALARYPDGVLVFHYRESSLLGFREYGAKVYAQGYIEIPEIQFIPVANAHTKKDTVYIVDSANEGVVAFVGDLAFSLFNDVMAKELQQKIDQDASMNPQGRIQALKEFLQAHSEITGYYLGHGSKKVAREELEEYVRQW